MYQIEHFQFPVGQGGLHLGVIGGVAYIYDCGSLKVQNSVVFLDKIIKTLEFYKIQQLFIFISHLHEDHVNMLQDLITQIPRNVRYTLYLPYITSTEKLYLLASSSTQDSWYTQFVINPLSTLELNKDGDVFYVSNLKVSEHTHEIDKTPIQTQDEVKSDLRTKCKYFDFIFDPFVYPHFTVSQKQRFQELIGVNVLSISEPELENLVRNDLEKIRKAYKALHSNINYTCLCLYVGPENYSISSYLCVAKYRHFINAGWLHTGDYVLKCGPGGKYGKAFVKKYSKYFNFVGVIQIPHHGSKNNISHIFIDKFSTHNVIFFFTAQQCPSGSKQPQYQNNLIQQISHPVLIVDETLCSGIINYI